MAEIVNKNTALVVESNSTEEYKEAQNTLKGITNKYKIPYSETAYKSSDIDKQYRKVMTEEDRRAMKNALGAINRFNQQQKNKASFE